MVSWFYAFMIFWFYGVMVTKCYHMSISCFREDIDPMSKIFKILLNGSSGLFGACLFQHSQNIDVPSFGNMENMFENVPGMFLFFEICC